jgi:uncharacterized membrane protein YbhN (UPF0104 family)
MTTLAAAHSRVRRLQIVLAAVPPTLLLGYLILRRASIEAGTDAISVASRGWIALGACCAVLIWLATTGSQLGAIDGSVPVGRLFATQVASSFVSHVLPAGTGHVGLTVRMLRRAGLSSEQVASAVVLNAGVGAAVHLVALLGLLAAVGAPAHIVNPSLLVALLIVLVLIASALPFALIRISHRMTPRGDRARAAVEHLRSVVGRPRRAALLVGSTAAALLLHVAAFAAVMHALHQDLPLTTVAVIYLGCSAAGAALPGLGGVGGLDLLLVSALISTGMTGGAATGAVIAYRMLTVWLPLLPGAATLAVMVRRGIV